MEFHSWEAMYSTYRKFDGFDKGSEEFKAWKEVTRDSRTFYEVLRDKAISSVTHDVAREDSQHKTRQLMRLTAEAMWYEANCPYYRIYPPYVDVFSETSLDIPTEYLQSPYQAFELRFPEGEEPRLFLNEVVESCLIVYVPTPEPGHSGLTVEQENELRCAGVILDEDSSADKFTLIMRTADKSQSDVVYHRYFNLGLWSGKTFNESFLETRQRASAVGGTAYPAGEAEGSGSVSEQELLDAVGRICRIAVSVMFLATGGDKLIEPDVLNKDFKKYLEAVNRNATADVQKLADKATRRRNQVGHSVGRKYYQEKILGRRSSGSYQDAVEPSEGRKLTHQHQRAGHLHRYWTGEGRKTLTMRFVPQVTVRPDLPPREEVTDKGTRTPKRALDVLDKERVI